MAARAYIAVLLLAGCAIRSTPITAAERHLSSSLELSEVIGVWLELHGCPGGELHLNRDWTYQHFCFDTIRTGKWTFRGSTLTLKHDVPDERRRTLKDEEHIIVQRVERLSDRMFIYLLFPDGSTAKYMKGA
jgi:hypothetical protein